MLVQEPVHAAIWHCLNHYAYGDATFLAERLFAEVSSDESLHLLATCYYRSGKLSQAFDVLSKNDVKTPQNKFLMAKCCVDLNKCGEAERLLAGDVVNTKKDLLEDTLQYFGESAGFALQLLAKIYASTERVSKSIEVDRKALKLNPLLWKSFEALCHRGDSPDPSKIFTVSNLESFGQCHGVNPILNYANQTVVNPSNNYARPQGQQPSSFASTTSTPILPTSNIQPVHMANNAAATTKGATAEPLIVLMITPVNHAEGQISIGSDSCFTASPGADNSRLMSGIGALNCSTDSDYGLAPLGSTQPRGLMPPPLRPRRVLQRRMNKTPSTPPVRDLRFLLADEGSGEKHAFGRLPRGALVFSSSGGNGGGGGGGQHQRHLCEPLMHGVRLDFSPLSVLSSCSLNPTPPTMSGCHDTSAPLINTTNNEQKISKRNMLAENSPLKANANVFGQSSRDNQNITPTTGSSTGIGNNIQSVRRSSRLFVSTQQSGKSKENTKGPPSAQSKGSRALKSPSRKAKSSRFANRVQSSEAEKNEKNKSIEMDDLSPPPLPPSAASASAAPPAITVEHTAEMLNSQALNIQKQSLEGLMQLMRQMGTSYLELAKFNSRKAVALMDNVAPHHRNTAWVQGLLGKAHFELGEYQEAKRYFQDMRDLDPHRMDFMEYYSTALWHLQEEVDLSALAQELTRIDKMAPQAWCAAGNCFSHQKEHENAIKFFQRAVQVQPTFAYAYTLLGHEYISIEELDKALACFRSAVRMDPRHYNAWYGIGLTYYRQDRFQLAEIYYRKALAINPQSPILMCHVAVVQHALQKTDKALETLSAAIKTSPKNPLCKFERASILLSSERYHEALEELNELKELVPKESPVYFLIGKVHNKLNNTHLALMHFSWAMDLDPKGANSQIKDALDPSVNRAAQDEAEVTAPSSSNDEVNVDDEHQQPDDYMMQGIDDLGSESEFQPEEGAATSQEESVDLTPPPEDLL